MSHDAKRLDAISFCEQCGDLRDATTDGNDVLPGEPKRGVIGAVRVAADRHARRHGHNVTFIRTETVDYRGRRR